eukprot:jgi/Mesen1/6091/ME000031S05362
MACICTSSIVSLRSLPSTFKFLSFGSSLSDKIPQDQLNNFRKSSIWERFSRNTLSSESVKVTGMLSDPPRQTSWSADELSNLPHVQRRELLLGTSVLLAPLVCGAGAAQAGTSNDPQGGSPGGASAPTKVFVVGATGNTGKRIVRELLSRGIKVRAGVRSLEKGRAAFPEASAAAAGAAASSAGGLLELVQADVTEGAAKLAAAMGDADAAICATGFQPGLDLTLAWKDKLSGGSISRDSVAEVAVEALFTPEASYKIVEIISTDDAPRKSIQELFAGL